MKKLVLVIGHKNTDLKTAIDKKEFLIKAYVKSIEIIANI